MKKDPALCSARSLVTGSEDLAAVAQLYADVAAGRRAALDQKEHAVAARLPRCGDSLGGLLRRGHRLLIDRQYDVAALPALLRRIACDRKRVVSGKSVAVRVDVRGRRIYNKKQHTQDNNTNR